MEAGVHSNIDEQYYHSDPCPKPSLSYSIAKLLITRSPHHAFVAHPKLNPNFESKESDKFDLGSAAHAMFLDQDKNKIQVIEADDWRTKAAKEEKIAAREGGRYPVLRHQFQSMKDMMSEAKSYIRNSEIGDRFKKGSTETTLIWQQDGDFWFRARLDWLSCIADGERILILDYKTTENAEPNAFGRIMTNMQYDMQDIFYKRGIEKLLGRTDVDFVFLAQETTPPYSCSLHSLSESAIEMAEEKVDRAINTWYKYYSEKDWPAYPNKICYQEPPAWALNQYLEQMGKPEE